MSDTYNYIIYDTLEDALVKADAEGLRRGFSYHKVGYGTRYSTYPLETSSGKFALRVDGYATLTEEEQAQIVTSVTFA